VVSAASHAALGAWHTAFAEQRFWIFWAGSSLGILILSSLLVEWTEPSVPLREATGWVLSVAGIALSLLGGLALLRIPALPVDEVVLLPPLLWAAVRFGARGASLAIALGATAFVAVGQWEPLAQVSPSLVHGTLGIQLFVGVGAVSLLAVAAVVEERWAAQERRVLLERAMDHSPDPAAILDEEGRFVWANAATARLLGASRAALLGRHAHALTGGTPADWRARWRKVAASGTVVSEDAIPRPGGPPVPFEVSAALVDAEGQQLLVSVFRDLTDRRRAEEASRLAALGTLAAGVAHEINNPLSYVVSNLAHVKDPLATLPDPDGTLRADVIEPLAEAEEGARRVRDIVRQLRAFARADEAPGPVDPGRALRSALAMAQNELRHRARVSTDLAATAPVLASENRLTQVFVNLLVNAAQAIPEGASDRNEVRVALFPRGDEVVAEIADTGAGMPAETRARIFEPFFTTRAPGGGSGLGLAISHSIVTKLGGRIEVVSTPGEGSVFRVILPAVPGAGESGEPPGPAGS
jgi:PAS domain S-box-containing protein